MAHSQPVADGAIFGGWFDVEDGRQILGDLALARADTRLYLHDREFFYVAGEKRRFLTGVLHDLRRVTLTGLNSISDLGSHHGRSGNFHYSELSPQQVLVGEEHIDPTVPSISKISFAIDDAFALFHDTDAFGLALDPRAAIRDVVQSTAELVGHGIATGENPLIAYFAGRRDIVSADTAIGRVSVDHYPLVHPFEGPSGAAIRNQILVQLDCTGPLPLSAALDHVMALLRFFELMGGRPQNLDQLRVAKSGAGRPAWLDVYWCRKPARSSDWQQEQVQPIEVLEDPIRHREQYEGLLRQWIATDYERMPARVRFSGGFQQQRHFPIDRLVGAANMFDILPKSAVPPPPSINADVQAARKAADAAFRSLPDSEDRQSVLGALKRIGTVTLRRKIEHRANLVSSALKNPLPHLDAVVAEAVRCRNYFVHGTPGNFDYFEHMDLTIFMAKALEFLFAASDLIDAGWDISRWRSRGNVLSHVFSRTLYAWDISAPRIAEFRAKPERGSSDSSPLR